MFFSLRMPSQIQTQGLIDYMTLTFEPLKIYRGPTENYHILFITTFTLAEKDYERQPENSGLIKIIKEYSKKCEIYSRKDIFLPQTSGVLESIAFPIGRFNNEIRDLFADVIRRTYDFVRYYPQKSKDAVSVEKDFFDGVSSDLINEIIMNRGIEVSSVPILFLLAQMFHYQNGNLGRALRKISTNLFEDSRSNFPNNMRNMMNGAKNCAETYNLFLGCGLDSELIKYNPLRCNAEQIQGVLKANLEEKAKNQRAAFWKKLSGSVPKETKNELEEPEFYPDTRRRSMSQKERHEWFLRIIGNSGDSD